MNSAAGVSRYSLRGRPRPVFSSRIWTNPLLSNSADTCTTRGRVHPIRSSNCSSDALAQPMPSSSAASIRAGRLTCSSAAALRLDPSVTLTAWLPVNPVPPTAGSASSSLAISSSPARGSGIGLCNGSDQGLGRRIVSRIVGRVESDPQQIGRLIRRQPRQAHSGFEEDVRRRPEQPCGMCGGRGHQPAGVHLPQLVPQGAEELQARSGLHVLDDEDLWRKSVAGVREGVHQRGDQLDRVPGRVGGGGRPEPDRRQDRGQQIGGRVRRRPRT